MEYTKEVLADKKVKVTITLNAEEWKNALNKAYEETKGKYKVEGFRNGKAPRKVIEREYGETVFFDEALNDSMYKYYNEVLTKEKLETVGNPKVDVEKVDETGVVLVITTAIYPEVKLGAYTGLKVEKETVTVTDAEINGTVQNMLEKSARMVKVDRAAKKGDTVIIDFVGKKDGVAFAGGTAKGYELVLGSDTFIPGFEDQLVGINAGDKKDINVTFPTDYASKELAGQPCVFEVNCSEVREKVLPKLDDEFAKNVSEFNTLEEYKASIKDELTKQKEKQVEQEAEQKLLDQIADNAVVDIPQEMVEEQADEFIHDFSHRLEAQGLKLDDYVKYMNTTVADLKNQRMEDARKTVRTRLVLEAIIKNEKIGLEREEVDKEIENLAKLNGVSLEDFKKTLNEQIMGQVANNIVVKKLLDFLKKNNNM